MDLEIEINKRKTASKRSSSHVENGFSH
jgi:hypothetical protein